MIVAAFMDPLGKRGIDETKAVNKEAANVIESLISSAESGVVHLPVPVLQAVHATLRKPYSVEFGRSLLELKSEATFTKDIMDIIRAIQLQAVLKLQAVSSAFIVRKRWSHPVNNNQI